MPCLHFDAEDYLDEVSDEDLEREMADRKMPLRQPELEDIRDRLERAWRQNDKFQFIAALAMMEAPDFSERRREQMALKYRGFITSRSN